MAFLNECEFRATAGGLGNFVVSEAIQGFYTPAQCTNPAVVNGATYTWRAETDALDQYELFEGTYTTATATVARTTILQSSNNGNKVSFSEAPRVRQVPVSVLGKGSIRTTEFFYAGDTSELIPEGRTSAFHSGVDPFPTWNASFTAFTDATVGAHIALGHSRSGTIGEHEDVENGDTLGQIVWYGSFNDDWRSAADLRVRCGVGTGTALPGYFDFRMRDAENQLVHCVVFTTGEDLSADHIASGGAIGVGCRNFFPERTAHFAFIENTSNTVGYILRLTRRSNGASFAAGIGGGIEYETETGDGNHEIGTTLESICTLVNSGAENFAFVIKIMEGGAAAAERLRIDSNTTANETSMMIWDVTAGSMRRVSIGAVDSGGSGFRSLRIPN